MALRKRGERVSLYVNPETSGTHSFSELEASTAEMMDSEEEMRGVLSSLNEFRKDAQMTDAILVIGRQMFRYKNRLFHHLSGILCAC